MIYLILLFSILYFYLAWRRLDWAVMLLIATLPSYLIRFQILRIPMTLLETMILISFLVWLIKQTNFLNFIRGKYTTKDYWQNRKARRPYPFGWELVMFIFIVWISAIVTGFSNQALGIWKAYFFEPALFFILVLNIFKTGTNETGSTRNKRSNGTEKIILSLAISAFAVSVLAIYQKITGNLIDNPMWAAAATRRSVSFYGYPNAVGLYLGPIVMILIGWLYSQISNFQFPISKQFSIYKFSILKTFFIALIVLLSLLSIYYAKSEGAIIGLLIALFVFAIFTGRRLRWTAIITLIIITGALMSYQPTRHFIEDKVQLHDLSGQIRRQQWKETKKMLYSSPFRFIFGSGLANYQPVIKPYHQEGIFVRDYRNPDWHRQTVISDAFRKKVWQPTEIYLYPHNILLNFWTELGLAGMLLFIWIIIKFFVIGILNLFRNRKLEIRNLETYRYICLELGLIGAMIVVIVHGIVDVPYFKNDLAVIFWLLIALLGLVNIYQNRTKEL